MTIIVNGIDEAAWITSFQVVILDQTGHDEAKNRHGDPHCNDSELKYDNK